jgi:putative ABC transport system permease protein
VLSSLAGHGTVAVPFGALRNGPATLTLRTPGCLDGGCRVVGIHLTSDTLSVGDLNLDLTFTVHTLGSINPVAKATGADLTTTSGWRAAAGTLTAGPAGLQLKVQADGLPDGAWIQPVDIPVPLPVATTTKLPKNPTLTGYDTHPARVTEAARVPALPRLGTDGTLIDLEYADRESTEAGPAHQPEVWLGAAAPPDALARLAKQGLIVDGDIDLATARDRLAAQGPALAVWFHLLAGVLAIILAIGGLGLIASIDSRSRTADLAALRAQGLPSRTSTRAVVSAYPALAVAAGVLGLLVALIAWRLTGWALPVFGEDHPPLPLPVWPDPVVLLGSWLGVTAALVIAALVTSRSTNLARGSRGAGSVAASTTLPATMMDPSPRAPALATRSSSPAHTRGDQSTVEER